jgi:hypothetical protein
MSRKTKRDIHAKRASDEERRRRLGLVPSSERELVERDRALASRLYQPGITLLTNPLVLPQRHRPGIIVLPGRGSPAAAIKEA